MTSAAISAGRSSGGPAKPGFRRFVSPAAAGVLAAASPAAGCAGSWLAGSWPAGLAAPCCARVMIRSAADREARQSGNVLLRPCWSSRYGAAGGACRPLRAGNGAQNRALGRTAPVPGRARPDAQKRSVWSAGRRRPLIYSVQSALCETYIKCVSPPCLGSHGDGGNGDVPHPGRIQRNR